MNAIEELEEILRLIDNATTNTKWFIMQTLEFEMGVEVQAAKYNYGVED